MPEKHCVEGAFRWVLPARAVADMTLGMSKLADVRAVVAKAVQGGQCSVSVLRLELDSGPMQGSALFRQALAEVADGIRSVPEGELRDLIKRGGLPSPMFNPRLFVGKRFIACPDCWWAREGVAVEVDSREWHFAPGDWEKTMHRHEVMGAHGIITLHLTPRRIRQDPAGVVSAIKDALAAGRARPPLAIRTVQAEG
jgi:very-short-patch-repair endonuclease